MPGQGRHAAGLRRLRLRLRVREGRLPQLHRLLYVRARSDGSRRLVHWLRTMRRRLHLWRQLLRLHVQLHMRRPVPPLHGRYMLVLLEYCNKETELRLSTCYTSQTAPVLLYGPPPLLSGPAAAGVTSTAMLHRMAERIVSRRGGAGGGRRTYYTTSHTTPQT